MPRFGNLDLITLYKGWLLLENFMKNSRSWNSEKKEKDPNFNKSIFILRNAHNILRVRKKSNVVIKDYIKIHNFIIKLTKTGVNLSWNLEDFQYRKLLFCKIGSNFGHRLADFDKIYFQKNKFLSNFFCLIPTRGGFRTHLCLYE